MGNINKSWYSTLAKEAPTFLSRTETLSEAGGGILTDMGLNAFDPFDWYTEKMMGPQRTPCLWQRAMHWLQN
jgi:hypothetical protein